MKHRISQVEPIRAPDIGPRGRFCTYKNNQAREQQSRLECVKINLSSALLLSC